MNTKKWTAFHFQNIYSKPETESKMNHRQDLDLACILGCHNTVKTPFQSIPLCFQKHAYPLHCSPSVLHSISQIEVKTESSISSPIFIHLTREKKQCMLTDMFSTLYLGLVSSKVLWFCMASLWNAFHFSWEEIHF